MMTLLPLQVLLLGRKINYQKEITKINLHIFFYLSFFVELVILYQYSLIHFGNFKSVFNNKIPDKNTITKQMSKAYFLLISNYQIICNHTINYIKIY